MKRTLDKIQQSVDEWVQQNGGYWSPLGMLAAILEELGEISRELLHSTSIKPKKENDPPQSLETELGDLFFAVICMANAYGISLDTAIANSIKKYVKRDAHRFKNNIEKED